MDTTSDFSSSSEGAGKPHDHLNNGPSAGSTSTEGASDPGDKVDPYMLPFFLLVFVVLTTAVVLGYLVPVIEYFMNHPIIP